MEAGKRPFRLTAPKGFGVMVIDMQADFLERMAPEILYPMIEEQQRVLEECHRLGIPVIFVEYEDHGSTIWELKRYAQRLGADVLIKDNDSAFRYHVHNSPCTGREPEPRNLRHVLEDRGIDSLFVMGVNANACVRETAESGLERGFPVMTAKSVIASSGYRMPDDPEYLEWFNRSGVLAESFESAMDIMETTMRFARFKG